MPEANFVPVTVSTNAALPAFAVLGLSDVTVGALTMGTDTAFDVMPEATTLTEAVPALAIILAGTVAFNCVVPTKLVVSVDLFQCTAALFEKPLPITLMVAAAVCTGTLAGFTALMEGPALMVNAEPAEVIPPEATVMEAEPVEAIRLAGTAAVT